MRTARFDRFGGPEVLHLAESPVPEPGEGEILIRVRAAGVSPVDLALRAGSTPSSTGLRLPHIPGVDAAGVVEQSGYGVTDVRLGDQVFGSVKLRGLGGASAEYAVLALWGRRSEAMPWEQAGAAASSIETATRALDLLDPKEHDTIVVDGAVGGVGSVAVQLAAARGARVLGIARPEHAELLTGLGAQPVPDGPELAERIRALARGTVEHVLDAAGAGRLGELIRIAGDAERVVTIADFSAPQQGARLTLGTLAGESDGRSGFAIASALAEQRRFRIPLRRVFPLDRIVDAHREAERRPRWGKIAVSIG